MEFEGIWVKIVGSVLTVVAVGLSWVARKLLNKIVEKLKLSETEKDLVELIAAGCSKAQDDFIRMTKAASSDGKLSKEEIQEAQDMVKEYVLKEAKGNVKDLALTYTKDRFGSWIKRIVSKKK